MRPKRVRASRRIEAPTAVPTRGLTAQWPASSLPAAARRCARSPSRSVDGARPRMMESFFGTMRRELLDRPTSWASRKKLSAAIFEGFEAWYNPRGRHTALAYLSPAENERSRPAAASAA